MARPRKTDQIVARRDLPECDEQVVHLDAVLAARSELPSARDLSGMAEIFSALADPTRLRIISRWRRAICAFAIWRRRSG
ncbi:MAG: hypothetical protein R2849_07425 [Thermomicrobiales bacterium]